VPPVVMTVPAATPVVVVPAFRGPAYGMTGIVALSSYVDSLLSALDAEGISVEQFHPEYAPGQLELSIAAADR